MRIIRLDNRGQISAEYLLLIVVILVVLGTITIPLVEQSVNASNDVSFTSDAKIAVESVASAINVVYANGPGSKRTLNIHIPQNGMDFTSDSDSINLIAALSDQNKTVTADINYPVVINSPTLNKNSDGYNVTVMWEMVDNVKNSFITVNVTAA